jgi:hypothetical protein
MDLPPGWEMPWWLAFTLMAWRERKGRGVLPVLSPHNSLVMDLMTYSPMMLRSSVQAMVAYLCIKEGG